MQKETFGSNNLSHTYITIINITSPSLLTAFLEKGFVKHRLLETTDHLHLTRSQVIPKSQRSANRLLNNVPLFRQRSHFLSNLHLKITIIDINVLVTKLLQTLCLLQT